jgi:hypothetical protein
MRYLNALACAGGNNFTHFYVASSNAITLDTVMPPSFPLVRAHDCRPVRASIQLNRVTCDNNRLCAALAAAESMAESLRARLRVMMCGMEPAITSQTIEERWDKYREFYDKIKSNFYFFSPYVAFSVPFLGEVS